MIGKCLQSARLGNKAEALFSLLGGRPRQSLPIQIAYKVIFDCHTARRVQYVDTAAASSLSND